MAAFHFRHTDGALQRSAVQSWAGYVTSLVLFLSRKMGMLVRIMKGPR